MHQAALPAQDGLKAHAFRNAQQELTPAEQQLLQQAAAANQLGFTLSKSFCMAGSAAVHKAQGTQSARLRLAAIGTSA